jgi:dolichol-phosphate mannosyltransferase
MTVPLTVLIPAYNEADTITQVLDAVTDAAYRKQIIVIDDGSKDGTVELIKEWARNSPQRLTLECHEKNRGKGAAIRTGLEKAIGEVVLIQDADLECDPSDYPSLVEPILRGEVDAVYGSRYTHPTNKIPWTPNRICVHLLNVMVRVLYGHKTTDEATCYKAVRRELLQRMNLQCERFEFCPEVTAKLCRMGARIQEVPILYYPRSVAAGKKIRWWDGVEAINTLIRWRFAPLNLRELPAAELPNRREAA